MARIGHAERMIKEQTDQGLVVFGLELRNPMMLGAIVTMAIFLIILALQPSRMDRLDSDLSKALSQGAVTKVAQAPDGATLWAIKRGGKVVYFSNGSVAVADAE